MPARRLPPLVAVFALVIGACAADPPAVGADPSTTGAAEAGPTTTSAAPTTTSPPPSEGVAIVPVGGAPLYDTPGGPATLTVHEGIDFPVEARAGDWLRVMTTCGTTAWVDGSTVDLVGRSTPARPGPGFDVAQAVVVLDPGHGAADWGGVGPGGLGEKTVNLDIADRLRALLLDSHDVDWATGLVRPGDGIPAIAHVFLTRDPAGPDDGDYQAVLAYRAALATRAGADAFIAIHNNTSPNRSLDGPGTEVYYSAGAQGSDRLGGLIYDEVVRSLARFAADWQGGYELGAIARVDPDTRQDYYTVLRRATVPSVIVEGAYISNPSEEDLLGTPAFRQAYAEGVYRGLLRFLTTTDESASVFPPVGFSGQVGSPSTRGCVIPSQPGT